MKKSLLPAFALALVLVCQSRADLYNFTFAEFDGGPSAAIGQIDVVGGFAVSGYLSVTGGPGIGLYDFIPASGTVVGLTESGTALYSSPLGYWLTDGVVLGGSNPFLTEGGLLFAGSGMELNLFYDSSSFGYFLGGRIGRVVNPFAFGTAALTAVPEGGATVAMLGVALIGIAVLRRRFVS